VVSDDDIPDAFENDTGHSPRASYAGQDLACLKSQSRVQWALRSVVRITQKEDQMNGNKHGRRSREHFDGFLHALYAREDPSTFRVRFATTTRLRRLGDWSQGYRLGRLIRSA